MVRFNRSTRQRGGYTRKKTTARRIANERNTCTKEAQHTYYTVADQATIGGDFLGQFWQWLGITRASAPGAFFPALSFRSLNLGYESAKGDGYLRGTKYVA